MKIGNSPEKLASTAVATERHGGTSEAGRTQANAGAKKGPEASAQIALSSTASSLLNGVSDEGSFDAEKVKRITQAISEGKFSVNADAIADKLIANAQEMLSRASPH
ncbi:flagellar biosynthesis anti-sigma factor FlgM [Paucibacter sp. APW11]|uniref:Negative regulator of flagellin synthesis n=1 Tax=Roseateles aquae TaxID=3077235 RepID=A0ABU3P9Q1_9BURK|nr:flagellar biosynthesis anti-sigma factor FlgM [Paucibacter sp. APW11]MDT8999303.1 flagellar biosynthesis anti-sigma factor FlgM [Paucibacter sp. APW11]